MLDVGFSDRLRQFSGCATALLTRGVFTKPRQKLNPTVKGLVYDALDWLHRINERTGGKALRSDKELHQCAG